MQVNPSTLQDQSTVIVLCQDTDVFALLCHFYLHEQWSANVYKQELSQDSRDVISIYDTVKRHPDMPHILAIHALFGCDTCQQCQELEKGAHLMLHRKCLFPSS